MKDSSCFFLIADLTYQMKCEHEHIGQTKLFENYIKLPRTSDGFPSVLDSLFSVVGVLADTEV